MKSILLRFPDKVIRYVRGKGVSEAKFEKIIGVVVTYGRICGWSRDNQEDFNGIGWRAYGTWEEIEEIIVEND